MRIGNRLPNYLYGDYFHEQHNIPYKGNKLKIKSEKKTRSHYDKQKNYKTKKHGNIETTTKHVCNCENHKT